LCSIQKSILELNDSLPQSFISIWITAEELHKRLVLAVIKHALKPAMVANVLRLHNTDECFMAKSVHNKVPYYRSKTAHLADLTNIGPCKQQFKKPNTGRKNQMNSSSTKFFIDIRNRHFDLTNDALSEIEEKVMERIN